MTGRRKAREAVLRTLYAYEIHPRDVDDVFEESLTDIELAEANQTFARQYIGIVLDHVAELDQHIIRLAENWELDRIAIIDKIILRMALAELFYMPDIPEKAAINEAIDLAKQYSTLESSSFVNGILDAALADARRKS